MTIGESALGTRPLFEMRLAVDPFLNIGGPEGQAKRIANVPGGSFEGQYMRGTVLPGGTDWQTLCTDGAVLLDARIVLQAEDGALIAMAYTGIRNGPPDVMAKLGRGEPVDPALYYFRIVASFATADSRFEWLNRIIAIGTGERLPEGPSYVVHEVL